MTWLIVALAAASVALVAVALLAVGWRLDWRIGRVSRILDRTGGACRRCGTTWRFATPHPTPYALTERGGRLVVIALCERCFDELATPEARYPYYAALLVELRERFQADGDTDAVRRLDLTVPRIVAAIRVGV